MTFTFEVTDTFKSKLKNFGNAEKKKVVTFITAFQKGGFSAIDNFIIKDDKKEYKVRNKSSDNVRTDDPDFVNKVKFAIDNKLWHFHAGFYAMDAGNIQGYNISERGDLTSQWVIHYQKFTDKHIKAVDITPHPPFDLPKEDALK
ncbi:hypothetical protein [Psychromonas sp.]|uniref:hypothetical protein n=1 Tax=Psychromonas sp. TaxID=1884585 RepID=UPI003A986E13